MPFTFIAPNSISYNCNSIVVVAVVTRIRHALRVDIIIMIIIASFFGSHHGLTTVSPRSRHGLTVSVGLGWAGLGREQSHHGLATVSPFRLDWAFMFCLSTVRRARLSHPNFRLFH